MIIKESMLSVADNSGAKSVLCIGFSSNHKKKSLSVGDIMKVSVKSAIPNSPVKSGEIFFAVIVRTKKSFFGNRSGTSFSDNAVVLLNKNLEMLGTRVFGSVSSVIKNAFPKIASLAPEVL